ncbi:RNA polymerase sigma factor RpoE [Labilithrix luteola]|uniref:RNA polymerase sigma factor RpoE n=1 Tax=Labilithrix luteola TaxID=1391654 RepID=A0A0K1PQ42_9BACT|nr:sigma-70 family RNA polymerase sigma factor [Labilithrix luteola]AKU95648.1 RNA polymerase sigma factor RpoE [Labilithrix luteola]
MSEAYDIAAIFRSYGQFVYTMLRSLGVGASDVDDAFQEVFVVIHRRLATYEERGTLRSWVYGICVRVAKDFRRRASRTREIATDEVPETIDTMTPAEHLGEQQARRILYAILDELDDDKRAVFVLFELEGLPMQEVAASLGCPVQTAYSRLRAAREAVDAALDRLRARRDVK